MQSFWWSPILCEVQLVCKEGPSITLTTVAGGTLLVETAVEPLPRLRTEIVCEDGHGDFQSGAGGPDGTHSCN